MLGIDDPLQQRSHQVDELDVLGDREQGNVQAVRLGDHLGRQLSEVGHRPDHQACAPGVGYPGDQADLRFPVVLDRKAGGEHQVACPRPDLGSLHQPHPLDGAVEAVCAAEQLGAGEGAKAHCLPYGGLRLGHDLGRLCSLAGGHIPSLVCGRRTIKTSVPLCREH